MIFLILHKIALVAPSWIGPVLALASGGTDAGGEEHGGDHSGTPHLPNLITVLFGEDSWAHDWVNVIFAFGIGVFLSVFAARIYSRRQMVPGKLQNFAEMMVEGMYNFVESILGHEAKKYVPYLGTLFFYILLMNWIGMVPLGHSPSTSLSITASLGILTFLYAQSVGVKRLGIGGYLYHMAGSPKDGVSWGISWLIFLLHVIGEFAKPVSLSLRLFGNITGEDTLIAVFVGLGVASLAIFGIEHPWVGAPLQFPFYFLGLLLSTIQALVFTLLSTIYILMMLPHEDHAH